MLCHTLKKLSFLVSTALLALTVVLSPLAAQAATYPITEALDVAGGWYIGVLGAVTWPKGETIMLDGELMDPTIGTFSSIKENYESPGWAAGGQIGYQSGPMRYEGQFIYMDANYDDLTTAGGTTIPSSSGGTEIYGGLLNAIYNFNPFANSAFSPFGLYLGAGVGYAHVRMNLNLPTAGVSAKGTGDEFGYQGIAGMAYNVDDTGSIFLDYRYFGTTSVAFTGERFQNHTVNLGVNFNLNV